MVRAEMMTSQQIDELVRLARTDAHLWDELKKRELEIEKNLADAAKQGRRLDDRDVILDPPMRPTMHEMVAELVKQRYGRDENFFHGSLVMEIRRGLREELGLPT
jgi:hypothetical protein